MPSSRCWPIRHARLYVCRGNRVIQVDSLIHSAWVVPVEPRQVVLPQHSIAIDQGRIVAILPISEAQNLYQAQRQIDLPLHVVCPGLVNLHGHSAMSLLRGLADDLTLQTWLQQHIWPAEAKHVRDEFVEDGTLLAIVEMLRGGTTCINDMYFYPEATARALLTAGMRGTVGAAILEFPTAYASDAAEYIHKALAARDNYLREPLLQFALAPHAPYTVSDATFKQIVTLAEQLQMPVHMHIHETEQEVHDSLQQYGMRPLARLKQLGLLTPDFVGIHAVHLEQSEIEMLAQHACHIAHNPSSNMKLASGIAPVSAMLAAGVNVGIGTDSAASNNRLDMFTEMRAAALLAKLHSGVADAVPAWQALEMATLGGARALGQDHLFGSLLPGKQADMIAVSLDQAETTPCYDPLSHLVYCVERQQVSDVWIGGRQVMAHRQLSSINTEQIVAKANWWRDKIRNQG